MGSFERWAGTVGKQKTVVGRCLPTRNYKHPCAFKLAAHWARAMGDKNGEKDNPSDFWHLRHWLQVSQLITWIHDNFCYLTIKSDTGEHLQFLLCFNGSFGCKPTSMGQNVLWEDLPIKTNKKLTMYLNKRYIMPLSLTYLYLFSRKLIAELFQWLQSSNQSGGTNGYLLQPTPVISVL